MILKSLYIERFNQESMKILFHLVVYLINFVFSVIDNTKHVAKLTRIPSLCYLSKELKHNLDDSFTINQFKLVKVFLPEVILNVKHSD